MGYTHYWTQTRDFTREEWVDAHEHITAILKEAQRQGIALANMSGDAGTSPKFLGLHENSKRGLHIAYFGFNGVDDDAHESFKINFKRMKEWSGERLGWDFCKTARKPYDVVVQACLSYLSTVVENFTVSSDGDGSEWLDGVEFARRALPRFANVLDIPMTIMESDRWCMPWVGGSQMSSTPYEVHFCVDGRGYVLKRKSREWYCFETHLALAQFLRRTQRVAFPRGGGAGWMSYDAVEPNIWNASGAFDKARHDRIGRAQSRALAPLFPVNPACAIAPPAYARPNQMPSPEAPRYSSFSDLLKAVENA